MHSAITVSAGSASSPADQLASSHDHQISEPRTKSAKSAKSTGSAADQPGQPDQDQPDHRIYQIR
eukprot:8727142-Pyramimonas_sp.AAC.1